MTGAPPDRAGALAPATLQRLCYEAIPGAASWLDVAHRANLPRDADTLDRALAQRAQLYAQRHARHTGAPWPHPASTIRGAGRPRYDGTPHTPTAQRTRAPKPAPPPTPQPEPIPEHLMPPPRVGGLGD